MATLESMIPNVFSLISGKVEQRKTHQQISDELMQLYPGVRGLSARSVRRFCDRHNIHSTSLLSNEDLDRVVLSSIAKVQNLVEQFVPDNRTDFKFLLQGANAVRDFHSLFSVSTAEFQSVAECDKIK